MNRSDIFVWPAHKEKRLKVEGKTNAVVAVFKTVAGKSNSVRN